MGSSLIIDDISAGYGSVRVLEGVSLTVDAGQTVVLLGTNGNGKTTLIRCIMGVCRPDTGHIFAEIDGTKHDLMKMSTEEIVDLGIALVPEGRRLFPKLTVEENLLLGAFRRTARARVKESLAYCYELFPRLRERRGQLSASMSGGEQQMLALARALMVEPKILIIDEPSVGLAPLFVARTMDAIKQLKAQKQLTVLMAEQNFKQAIRIADAGYVIVHGRIAHHGDTRDSLSDNELIRRLYLGA